MAVLRVLCLPGVVFGWLCSLALNVCVEVCIIMPLRGVEQLFPSDKRVEQWSKGIDRWRRKSLGPLCPMLDDRPLMQQVGRPLFHTSLRGYRADVCVCRFVRG
jgi:hypothetical protein